MRLDKAISLSGMTRTEARRAIQSGRVFVCGIPAREIGMQVNIVDVSLDGAPVSAEEQVYLMLNKPAGVVTATEDKHFPTVVSLIPEKYARRKIGPVGRLDRDVTGLVLLTTDGILAHRLISPKWKAEKVYRATCEGRLDPTHVDRFAEGIALSDFTARPANMKILSAEDEHSVADVTLTEGKFHQVKRMFIAIGHPLLSLKRLKIGCVQLDDALAEGESRLLTNQEIDGLKCMSGLSSLQ